MSTSTFYALLATKPLLDAFERNSEAIERAEKTLNALREKQKVLEQQAQVTFRVTYKRLQPMNFAPVSESPTKRPRKTK
jgi:hypothetical protein